jgi:hypothetical protein
MPPHRAASGAANGPGNSTNSAHYRLGSWDIGVSTVPATDDLTLLTRWSLDHWVAMLFPVLLGGVGHCHCTHCGHCTAAQSGLSGSEAKGRGANPGARIPVLGVREWHTARIAHRPTGHRGCVSGDRARAGRAGRSLPRDGKPHDPTSPPAPRSPDPNGIPLDASCARVPSCGSVDGSP